MNDDDLCRKSATELLPELKAGKIKAATLMRAVLDRVERLDQQTNGIAHIDPEAAIAEAEARDAALAAGEPAGEMQGLPVTVKDLLKVKGLPMEMGSFAFEGQIIDNDAVAIARLRAKGAIPFAKTATPEFGHKVLTDSPTNGISHNPWNLDRSCGGSSGGSGICAAMGFGPLHVSTDGAGSGRIPASACGVAGIKPTWGAIPHETTTDIFGSFTCIGVMARTVCDLAIGLNGMKGPNHMDPWSHGGSTAPIILPADPASALKGLRMRVVMRTLNDWVDPEVEAAVLDAVNGLIDAGIKEVDKIEDPVYDNANALIYMRSYQYSRFGHLLEKFGDRMDPTARMSLTPGLQHTYDMLAKAMRARTEIFHEIERQFDEADFYITPTITTPSLSIDHKQDQPLVVNGIEHGPLREAWYPYTVPQNASGHPAISVPIGMSSSGVPIGMQIVGPWHSEARLLTVAGAIEALFPWAAHWPPAAV
ncbi:amidase [Sulfitobacter sp. F26204]|uniref:amidase n=1 Tax=Sulfitobacter sp. F26204 TaxID=2996014 RepID=UPI00225DE59A|nr:amidase [Sulfitobacter sp. F26204]MCX7561251.1 amidase [Sulfitobacter sp. F26204]